MIRATWWMCGATALCASLSFGMDAHAATLVFADDFEGGTTDLWEKDGGRDRCIVAQSAVDGGTVHAGSSMLECNWNGIVAWDDPAAFSTLKLSSWDYTSEFLVRFWVRYDADVDHKFGSKLFRLDPNNAKDSYYCAGQMEQTGGPLISTWEWMNSATGPISTSDKPFANGEWHKIEIYMKATEGNDGVVRVWQDGEVMQEESGLTTIASGDHWYPLYVMSNWSNNLGWEHDDVNHVYWDDFEIYSDATSGTPASGSLSDATATVGGSPSTSSSATGAASSTGSNGGSSGSTSGSSTGAGGGGGGLSDSTGGCTIDARAPHDGALALGLAAGMCGLVARRRRANRSA